MRPTDIYQELSSGPPNTWTTSVRVRDNRAPPSVSPASAAVLRYLRISNILARLLCIDGNYVVTSCVIRDARPRSPRVSPRNTPRGGGVDRRNDVSNARG